MGSKKSEQIDDHPDTTPDGEPLRVNRITLVA